MTYFPLFCIKEKILRKLIKYHRSDVLLSPESTISSSEALAFNKLPFQLEWKLPTWTVLSSLIFVTSSVVLNASIITTLILPAVVPLLVVCTVCGEFGYGVKFCEIVNAAQTVVVTIQYNVVLVKRNIWKTIFYH